MKTQTSRAPWQVPAEWAGEPVFIVAGGPSVLTQPIELLQGRRVIAINSSYTLVPFADVLFFGDSGWWSQHSRKVFGTADVPPCFLGRVVTTSATAPGHPRLLRLTNSRPPRLSNLPLTLSTNPSVVPMRRTSLAPATNLAFLLNGGAPIVWLGADGRLGAGNRSHHHAPHRDWKFKAERWPQHRFDLTGIVAGLKARGVMLINASPSTAWDDLAPVMPLAEAIDLLERQKVAA